MLKRFVALIVAINLLIFFLPVTEASSAIEAYRFVGHGYNHGVGMCMAGCYTMAVQGFNHWDIFRKYYTGVELSWMNDDDILGVKYPDGSIHQISFKEYLYRLAEEPDTWPMEGLKATIVAARTYAYEKKINPNSKHKAEGFDICSSGACCQAFNPDIDPSTHPNQKRAVDETSGEIITYAGKPIAAAYSSCCGGHTENIENVWAGGSSTVAAQYPYLRGVPCGYCTQNKNYSWDTRIDGSPAIYTRTELENIFNQRGVGVGHLYGIDMSRRGVSGRLISVTLYGSQGTRTINGYTQFANYLGLKSSLVYGDFQKYFSEFILIQNPNAKQALVAVSFYKPDGSTAQVPLAVGPYSRFSLDVSQLDPSYGVRHKPASIKVGSYGSDAQPIIAERSMYFNFTPTIDGGHNTLGALPSNCWYFAEGCTVNGFNEYLLISNPNNQPTLVAVTLRKFDGSLAALIPLFIEANSRYTLLVGNYVSAPSVWAKVESYSDADYTAQPIVAERAMYFNYLGNNDGHVTIGATQTANTWYFAEGCTINGFNEYLLISNPNNQPTLVAVTLMRPDGSTKLIPTFMQPNSRTTLHVNEHAPGQILAAKVESYSDAGYTAQPVVAERSTYFSGSRSGGHVTVGSTSTSTQWYFSEGYTGNGFDTYILIQNPDDSDATVVATFYKNDGSSVQTSPLVIKAHSRGTVHVNSYISHAEVATKLTSQNGVGIVAERAMYFSFGSTEGGHVTVGATALRNDWYFAEGYQGY